MYWPTETIIEDEAGNIISCEFSETPEAFAARLKVDDKKVYVASKCCKDCFYVHESITRGMKKELYSEQMIKYSLPECICATAVKRVSILHGLPSLIICYGYFYLHHSQNVYLSALIEADVIQFIDVSEFSCLKDLGVCAGDHWVYDGD